MLARVLVTLVAAELGFLATGGCRSTSAGPDCVPHPPSFPERDIPDAAPSQTSVGLGGATRSIRTINRKSGDELKGQFVRVTSSALPQPLWLRTNDHGLPRANRLAPGEYEVEHFDDSEPHRHSSTRLENGVRSFVRFVDDVRPLQSALSLTSTDLAPDALPSIRSGGCFGGLRAQYQIDALEDGSVRLPEDGKPIPVRRLGKRALSATRPHAQVLGARTQLRRLADDRRTDLATSSPRRPTGWRLPTTTRVIFERSASRIEPRMEFCAASECRDACVGSFVSFGL